MTVLITLVFTDFLGVVVCFFVFVVPYVDSKIVSRTMMKDILIVKKNSSKNGSIFQSSEIRIVESILSVISILTSWCDFFSTLQAKLIKFMTLQEENHEYAY